MTRGLLDTSVVIAESVESLPDEAAISVITLAELHFGVHMARDADSRKLRIRRLSEIESRFDALPVDEAVARTYGTLAHAVASSGRSPRSRAMDVLIAATAQVHDAILFTRNERDFQPFADMIEIRRV
ncbi:MAG: type II toxin-antitoxin system VapC family toxin [Actinomycetota bacterium]